MMRRLLHNEVFQSMLGVLILGPLAIWGLLVPDAPRWVKACAGVICVLALLAPALPLLALLPWHFLAVHRGLVSRSDQPRTVDKWSPETPGDIALAQRVKAHIDAARAAQ